MTVGSDMRTCFANVKNIEATLQTLAIQTTDEEKRKMYEEVNQLIIEIKKDLDNQLIFLTNEEPQYKS